MPVIQIEHLDRTTSETEIAAFERKFNVHLPSDYREFLLAHNVCIPIPNICSISREQGEGEVRYLVGFSEEDFYSLEWFMDVYKSKEFPRIPLETLPIGMDSFGNLYCIVTQGENCGFIYFWDHDWENEGRPDYTNMYFLAASFSDFLNQLHESEYNPSA